MQMHMACADDRMSPGNLGVHHYPYRRGQFILEEATDRPFHTLHRYKMDYVSKRSYSIGTYYGGNVRLYAFVAHVRH